MDGFGFFEGLRTQGAWRDIPIVVITAGDLTREERLPLDGHVQRARPRERPRAHECENRDSVENGLR